MPAFHRHWRHWCGPALLGSVALLLSVAGIAGDKPADAAPPNVVIVLLDDTGFGASSTFGGPAQTPALDRLAQQGLRYNRFHTTAICSPTRAALLTGRDAHVANVGTVINSSHRQPGYQGRLRPETATIATVLQQRGYATGMFGKWHLVPNDEATPAGPFTRWPTGQGFDTFYGFMGGETDQFEPTLYQDTRPVQRPAGENYHLSEDLAQQAAAWMRLQKSLKPERPFFLYFATGATHAPLQVPQAWIDQYRGQFSAGWDALRQQIFERQKALGVIPADTVLTPRPESLPAWDSLSDDERRIAERLMETFAGFLSHTDHQVGVLVDTLAAMNELDNTLFIYIVGDNGGSAEGGLGGSVNYMGPLQGLPEPTARKLSRLKDVGGPDTFSHFNSAWAWATNTPFQWVKQVASHLGGTRNPMVVSWPARIRDTGGLRSQFAHVNDVVPTLLDVLNMKMPATVNGVAQLPMDGASLLPSFMAADAPEHRHTQYFEVHGNRGIYHDGWWAAARHSSLPWTVGTPVKATPFEDDVWELYHLEQDFSQAQNLAQQQPQKLAAMQALFQQEAERVGIWPLRNALVEMRRQPQPSLGEGRQSMRLYPGAIGIPEHGVPAMTHRSWRISATLDQPASSRGSGVIATVGGTVSGWSLYLNDTGHPVFEYRLFEVVQLRVAADKPLPPGQHTLTLDFVYDGGGYARGGEFRLSVDGKQAGSARTPASVPAYYSIDETFDVGLDTGSPAGHYPQGAPLGYPLTGIALRHLDIELQ